MVPGNSEQAYNATPGFLPPGLAAFKTGGKDLSDPGWTVPNLARFAGMSLAHLAGRRNLLGDLEAPFRP
jgi:hypothetical protein